MLKSRRLFSGVDVRAFGAIALSLSVGGGGAWAFAQPVLADAASPAEIADAEPVMRYDGHSVVRVTIRTSRDLRTALALTDDVWSHQVGVGGEIDIRVSPAQFEALAGTGMTFSVLIEDVQQRIDAERAEIDRLAALAAAGGAGADNRNWFQTYHPWDEIRQYVQDLVTQYPDLATYEVVGQSVEGRDIFAIRITGTGVGGGSTPVAQRPAVFFNGCQHAREWVSPATVVYIADRLLSNYATDPRTRALLDNIEFVIVPVVNPDGYIFSWTTQRLWRKNRAVNSGSTCFGVDTNRNFGFEWGGVGASTNPCNDTFRGPAAFSEPETQAVRDYITANTRIAAAIDFHSYSELILSPWGYTPNLPPGSETFDLLNSAMQLAIASVHGRVYAAGPGYTTIYPTTGSLPDWTWGGRAIYGWTIELRDTGQFGFVLPPDQIIPTAEENIEGVYALAAYFLPLRFTEPVPAPSPVQPGTAAAVEIGIGSGSGVLLAGSPVLRARVGSLSAFTSIPMQEVSPGRYSALVPGASCGQTIEYYFEAQTNDARTFSYPVGGAAQPLTTIALEASVVYSEDFETATGGWTVFNHSSLTAGAWERAMPIGAIQNNVLSAPNAAAGGQWAFVTQNGLPGGGPGAADVDGGPTILTSPAIDLAGVARAEIGFSFWHYSVGGTVDEFLIDLSDDDGQTWTRATTLRHATGWRTASVDVGANVGLTSTVRIRFTSIDNPNNSVTESGIDDVMVRVWGCAAGSCYANCDGSTTEPVLNIDDFACFINSFALAQALPHEQQVTSYANCDGSTVEPALNIDDFACFINAFALGCR
jgi:murein tripeptide amidase MpaA